MQKTITGRWLFNILGIVLLLLLLVEAAFAWGIRTYYYAGVDQILNAEISTYTSLLESASDPSKDYNREVRAMIQNFLGKDRMEFMALDIEGNVISTSSGFEINEKLVMPDFTQALASDSRIGYHTGEINTAGGTEHIKAVTMLATPMPNEPIAALRFVVSLELINERITTQIVIAAVFGVVVIFFAAFSGLYFINSIVIPVGEVTKTARKIAQGDFAARLAVKTEDEIGALCRTINHMAEELSASEKLKNEFISSVSHELRTPLTAIKGWGETLMSDEGISRNTVEKGMRVIMNETDRLSLMVEELLDFSRMQSGRMKYVFDKMDILAELGEAVLMYTERAKREGIELKYDEPDIFTEVMGDKNRLRQVFINIIDNAIKYSNAGGTVEVQAGEENGMIYITVSDNGLGISESDLPKIKERFYKANHNRRGSGIGLAVADEIVAAHGGSLDIISQVGQGTAVTILIPTAATLTFLFTKKEK